MIRVQSPTCHKEIPVLWKVFDAPHGGFMCTLTQACETSCDNNNNNNDDNDNDNGNDNGNDTNDNGGNSVCMHVLARS